MLEKAKLQQQAVIQIRQIEYTRPAAVPVGQEMKYIPRLSPLQSEDLHIVLARFLDSMKAAQIHEGQWVARLRNILTGPQEFSRST